MNIKSGIGYSPLTEKIYWGKQNKEKRIWVGEKTDITNDFINVLFEYIGPNEYRKITTINGLDENIVINVKKDKASLNKVIKFLQKELTEIKNVK